MWTKQVNLELFDKLESVFLYASIPSFVVTTSMHVSQYSRQVVFGILVLSSHNFLWIKETVPRQPVRLRHHINWGPEPIIKTA